MYGAQHGFLAFQELDNYGPDHKRTFILSGPDEVRQLEIFGVSWLDIESWDQDDISGIANFDNDEILLATVINDTTNSKRTLGIFKVAMNNDDYNYISAVEMHDLNY